jgi:hypothetical protein
MENRFETLLSDKNTEITQLKGIINELERNPIQINGDLNHSKEISKTDNDVENLATKITKNEKLYLANKTINYYIQGGYNQLVKADNITTEILSFYQSNKLIESIKPGYFTWTAKGDEVNKLISLKNFNKNCA